MFESWIAKYNVCIQAISVRISVSNRKYYLVKTEPQIFINYLQKYIIYTEIIFLNYVSKYIVFTDFFLRVKLIIIYMIILYPRKIYICDCVPNTNCLFVNKLY